MKLVNDVLVKVKGEGKSDETICGKGTYSNQLFENVVNALANDTTYMVTELDKDGKEVSYNISKQLRDGLLKKSAINAKCPQKSELDVYNTSEINTTGISKLLKHSVDIVLRCGKKFDLLPKKDMNASLYLSKVAANQKTLPVKDIKTKENRGTTTITNEEYIQLRAKSPVPKHLQKKVRRDVNGNIITK